MSYERKLLALHEEFFFRMAGHSDVLNQTYGSGIMQTLDGLMQAKAELNREHQIALLSGRGPTVELARKLGSDAVTKACNYFQNTDYTLVEGRVVPNPQTGYKNEEYIKQLIKEYISTEHTLWSEGGKVVFDVAKLPPLPEKLAPGVYINQVWGLRRTEVVLVFPLVDSVKEPCFTDSPARSYCVWKLPCNEKEHLGFETYIPVEDIWLHHSVHAFVQPERYRKSLVNFLTSLGYEGPVTFSQDQLIEILEKFREKDQQQVTVQNFQHLCFDAQYSDDDQWVITIQALPDSRWYNGKGFQSHVSWDALRGYKQEQFVDLLLDQYAKLTEEPE